MKQTALYNAHIEMGAKTGEFAGYDMPLYYKDGVMAEHEWVRAHAGIFDVSHMGQVIVTGEKAQAFFETVTLFIRQSAARPRQIYGYDQ